MIDVKLREPLKQSNAVVLRLKRKKSPHVLFLNANPVNTEEIDALSLHTTLLLVLETCTI